VSPTRFAAALAAVLLPLAALAQLPPPRTPEPRMPPKPGMRVPPAPKNPGVSLTWFGQSAFALRAPSSATVLFYPFSPQIGLPAPAEKLPADVVAITHEHPDHNDVGDWAAGQPKVLHGLAEGGKEYAKVEPEVHKLAQALQREIDLVNSAAQQLETIAAVPST
jgi:hypothetical protein